MTRGAPLNYILLIFLAVSVVLQVFILNRHSTVGDSLTVTNQKIVELEKENNQISQKIASLSAMSVITQKAKDYYGLDSTAQIISLASSLPLAANLKLSL